MANTFDQEHPPSVDRMITSPSVTKRRRGCIGSLARPETVVLPVGSAKSGVSIVDHFPVVRTWLHEPVEARASGRKAVKEPIATISATRGAARCDDPYPDIVLLR